MIKPNLYNLNVDLGRVFKHIDSHLPEGNWTAYGVARIERNALRDVEYFSIPIDVLAKCDFSLEFLLVQDTQ